MRLFFILVISRINISGAPKALGIGAASFAKRSEQRYSGKPDGGAGTPKVKLIVERVERFRGSRGIKGFRAEILSILYSLFPSSPSKYFFTKVLFF